MNSLNLAESKNKEAIFAGGCFWCLQADFSQLSGILEAVSGYDGGHTPNPSYEQVCSGSTQYAECVKVVYDSEIISYSQLLDFFWKHIDPTVKDAQFCDYGTQYRTAIFHLNEEQKNMALASLEKIKLQFPQIYTQVVPSTHFYPAESYHQDYYLKNPIRYKYYRWSCGRESRLKELWKDHSKS